MTPFTRPMGRFNWSRLSQSMSSITSGDEYENGAIILEGHRIFEYPNIGETTTSIVYLASNDRLVEQRSKNAEQLSKLRTSARKHKLFVHKQYDQDDSLLKSPNLCTLSGDTRKWSWFARHFRGSFLMTKTSRGTTSTRRWWMADTPSEGACRKQWI